MPTRQVNVLVQCQLDKSKASTVVQCQLDRSKTSITVPTLQAKRTKARFPRCRLLAVWAASKLDKAPATRNQRRRLTLATIILQFCVTHLLTNGQQLQARLADKVHGRRRHGECESVAANSINPRLPNAKPVHRGRAKEASASFPRSAQSLLCYQTWHFIDASFVSLPIAAAC